MGELRIVGSVTYKARPRDLDVLLAIDDGLFAGLWMQPKHWVRQGETGKWTKARWRWARDTLRLAKALGPRIASKRPLDFRIVPRSTVR